jgi:DNA-binding Lrp family transcriptional regulator
MLSRDYRRGNKEVKEMKKMMDIGKKILAELDQKPGDTFSLSAIARALGATPKATGAALGRLFKAGLVTRPQKGVYTSKGRSPQRSL